MVLLEVRFKLVVVGESSSGRGVLNADQALKGVKGEDVDGDNVSKLLLEVVDLVLNMTRRVVGLVVKVEGVLGAGAAANEVVSNGRRRLRRHRESVFDTVPKPQVGHRRKNLFPTSSQIYERFRWEMGCRRCHDCNGFPKLHTRCCTKMENNTRLT